MKILAKTILALMLLLTIAKVNAEGQKISFFIVKSVANRGAGFAEGAAISKSGVLIVLANSQKYGWELKAPYGNESEKNLIISKLGKSHKIEDSSELKSFYESSSVAFFRQGVATELTEPSKPSRPQPQAASGNLIDTKNKATTMGSCAGIASVLQLATNKLGQDIMSQPAQNADQRWQRNKDAEQIHNLGKSGKFFSQRWSDHKNMSPSMIHESTNAQFAAMSKAQQLSSTSEGAIKVIQAFERCNGN